MNAVYEHSCRQEMSILQHPGDDRKVRAWFRQPTKLRGPQAVLSCGQGARPIILKPVPDGGQSFLMVPCKTAEQTGTRRSLTSALTVTPPVTRTSMMTMTSVSSYNSRNIETKEPLHMPPQTAFQTAECTGMGTS